MIKDRRVVPLKEAIDFLVEGQSLTLRRRASGESPLVLVLRLPLAGFTTERPADGGPDIGCTFATDGQPINVGVYPYSGPVMLHADQLVPGTNWTSLVLEKTDVRPISHPVRLEDGRVRVPGRLIFEAAVKEVKPVIPPDFVWGDRREQIVLVRVEITRKGQVASVSGLQGDAVLVDSVRKALLQWEFDMGRFFEQADIYVTNLPFRFRKPRD